MISREIVTQSIFEAIDEVNGQLSRSDRLEKTENTALFGSNAKLDSLGLVSLVTTIEQKIEEDLGIPITILEDIEALENENPFETVSTLTDYLISVLEKTANE